MISHPLRLAALTLALVTLGVALVARDRGPGGPGMGPGMGRGMGRGMGHDMGQGHPGHEGQHPQDCPGAPAEKPTK